MFHNHIQTNDKVQVQEQPIPFAKNIHFPFKKYLVSIGRKVFHISYTFQTVKVFDQVTKHGRLHLLVTLKDISNKTRNTCITAPTVTVHCVCMNKTNRTALTHPLEFLIAQLRAELSTTNLK